MARRFLATTIIHVEVGLARALSSMAKANPEINTSGLIFKNRSSICLGQGANADVPNIKLLWVDGSDLTDYLKIARLTSIWTSRITWPKKRHEKRAVWPISLATYQQFCQKMEKIFGQPQVHEYSLVKLSVWYEVETWLDLHASDFEDNVLTEYEQKFANKGQVIYRVEAAFEWVFEEVLLEDFIIRKFYLKIRVFQVEFRLYLTQAFPLHSIAIILWLKEKRRGSVFTSLIWGMSSYPFNGVG